jgi:hypothetical protein
MVSAEGALIMFEIEHARASTIFPSAEQMDFGLF